MRQEMHQMLLGLALAANVSILKPVPVLSLGVPGNEKTNVLRRDSRYIDDD